MKKIPHKFLDINILYKSDNYPYILFIHGGPGLNSQPLQYMVRSYGLFDKINANVIFYDQRSCGASSIIKNVSHKDNIEDLKNLVLYLEETQNILISSIIGHSYGAKLLSDTLLRDYIKKDIKIIYLSTSTNILEPRFNNMMFDLFTLKTKSVEKYKELFSKIEDDNLWELTSKIDIPFDIKERSMLYWSNLDMFDKISQYNNPFKMNQDVFISIRKEIYDKKASYDININIENPKILIVGFHDYIMNGYKTFLDNKSIAYLFMKSAHFPHIEENEKFCEIINKFIS